METEKLRAHLARLIKELRETGLCLLDQMETAGEISHDDRRLFQYTFCSGMGDAHFIMEKPKEALASNRSLDKDRHISSTIESGIRMRAEDWLEYMLGDAWRLADISNVQFLPSTEGLREHLTKLRAAVRAKPSEVEKRLDERVTIKCSHCHQPGHSARLCPFKSRGVTTESEACGDGRTAGA